MSTRCQIQFIDEHGEKRTVYRHSDGYPDGVIPDLQKFLKWNDGRNNDVEYQAANFIYWSKKQREERINGYIKEDKKAKKKVDHKFYHSQLLLGFGVCNDDIHWDIDYFYKVISRSEKIIVIQTHVVSGGLNEQPTMELEKETPVILKDTKK